MGKHIFPPDGSVAASDTVPLAELYYALMDKELGPRLPAMRKRQRKTPWSDRPIAVKAPSAHLTIAARMRTVKSLLTDLRHGVLVAHAHHVATGQFRKIPMSFWYEDFVGLSLGGELLDMLDASTFPPELKGSTIYVAADRAQSWLKQHGLAAMARFAASTPGRVAPAQPRKRSTRYDWPSFERYAASLLDEEGDYHTNWRQADLEREMLQWCQDHWEREPAMRSVRDHVRIAHEWFIEQRKAIGLGNLGK